ncbi:MAG TPA: hypothetical protein EYH34_11725 [Planctomycetes bacterium]|nr:hypothetical protein [Planctomycetota bacterium]
MIYGQRNGARGVYFWSGRVWDAEDLIAMNRVVRAIAPVEDVIVKGEPIGDAASVTRPARLGGMRRGDEMILLVADYFGRTGGTVKLSAAVSTRSPVRELLTREPLSDHLSSGEVALTVNLGKARARFLHVQPID